jgi:hypothetical protein
MMQREPGLAPACALRVVHDFGGRNVEYGLARRVQAPAEVHVLVIEEVRFSGPCFRRP